MPLFKREDPGAKAAREAQETRMQRNLEELAKGRLPLTAQERIQEQAAAGTWTSDLSVDEVLAIRAAGFEPVGQVMGSSVYHIGWMYSGGCGRSFGTFELGAYARALYDARQLALGRMRQEATGLGGHGVVGVRLTLRSVTESGERSGLIEFTAIGTAVQAPRVAPVPEPFLSALDGQDFAKLLSAGYVPCGLVMGVVALHVHTSWRSRSQMGGMFAVFSTNQEVDQYTQAVLRARQLAMSRLRDELQRLQADGAVGADIGIQVRPVECRSQEGLEDHQVEFFALGTAVKGFARATTPHPTLAARLDDRTPNPIAAQI